MKGDFAKAVFDPVKHFVRVLLQQGRVTLDADAANPRGKRTVHHRLRLQRLKLAGATPRFASLTSLTGSPSLRQGVRRSDGLARSLLDGH